MEKVIGFITNGFGEKMTLTGITPTSDSEYRRYRIRASETGDEIIDAESIDEAIEIIKTFENDDKNDGIYVERFYEIYDRESGEIVAYEI